MSTLDAVRAALVDESTRIDGRLAGIGIDYEPWRESADLRTSRFFLRPAEQACALDGRSLLRLWTVKEALFKATPDNGDAVLVDYRITDPQSRCGGATGPRGEAMRYFSIEMEHGWLTVALCLAGGSGNGAV